MENLQPPKTIEEVGIHLLYMSQTVNGLSNKFDAFQSNYVPISAFLEYKEETKEIIDQLKTDAAKSRDFQSSWAGRVWGISTTIVAVFAVITIVIQHYWK